MAALALAVMASASGGGCYRPDDTLINFTAVSVGSGMGTGGEGASTGPLTAREYFDLEVKEGMINNCAGADCHSSGSVAFLLSGQEYASITTYASSLGLPLVTNPASISLLLTYPSTEEHSGKAWGGLEELRSAVNTWLQLEAEDIQPTPILQVGPIDVNGFTVLPLGGLGPEYNGFTMTFYAAEYGVPAEVLELSQISIWPANGRGMRVVNPTFVFLPPQGSPIFDESFHGEPYNFVAPGAVVMGGGELLATDWGNGYQLAIRFEEISRLFADDDGNTFQPCTKADLFRQGVDLLPIQSAPNATNGLLYCAEQCHGGADGAEPTNVMNLSPLLGDDRDYAFACAVARAQILPTQVALSPLVVETNPQVPSGHPFIFGGNTSAHAGFRDAMTPWIEQEGTTE